MPVPSVSFEIFPPASMTASFRLWESMARLQVFTPKYVSVTYGAQGSVQNRTLDTAQAIMQQTGLPVAAHLTAARASKEEVLTRAQEFADAGIEQIVALRGDPDRPGAAFSRCGRHSEARRATTPPRRGRRTSTFSRRNSTRARTRRSPSSSSRRTHTCASATNAPRPASRNR